MSGGKSGHDPIFQPGDLLNNTYRIEAALGRGGTSEVYRARSEISGRVVALKALRSEFSRNEDYLALMRREEDIREIRHDSIVRYYDNQRTDDGTVYLVMDYVEGPGLDKKLKSGGMSAADLVIIAARVSEGLAAAHAKNIVHRDLSPDNIILRGGNPAEAVIIDFGIAKDTNPGAETIVGNEFAGKYAYAAPEQLAGNTDERADIYALGALLLATFRGKAPDSGSNPMEVVTRKAQPLDTSGVPEPLKSLIDQMTQPDRTKRLPNAAAVLEAIRRGAVATEDNEGEDSERTVIMPRKAAQPVPVRAAAQMPPPPVKPAPKAADAPRQGRGGLLAAMALVVVAVLGGGAYMAGLFGPQFAVADPFVLVAERKADATAQAVGNVPSADVEQALSARMASVGGGVQLTLASGAISDSWGPDVMSLIDAVAALPEWRVAASGNQVKVTGLALTRDDQKRLMALPIPAGLTGSVEIALGPRILTVEAVQQVLAAHADCGELSVANPVPTGFPVDASVVIAGKVAEVATQVALNDALIAALGPRTLRLEVEVLNPTLCTVDAALPNAPQGGFDLTFGFGDRPDANPTARYFVGENPVIDVTIPADVTDGFLYVSALDVSGNVFHLLPNLNREDNSIATLRNGRSGTVTVRVAYGIDEAKALGRLAFTVDDTSLGKTRLLVIHAKTPIFDALRPTTESAEGFAQALKSLTVPVASMDSRILTTAKP
ncbi:MAG: protein kinase [Pseudomonadota bacterium]